MIVEGRGQQLGEVQVDKKRPDIESGNVNELRSIEKLAMVTSSRNGRLSLEALGCSASKKSVYSES